MEGLPNRKFAEPKLLSLPFFNEQNKEFDDESRSSPVKNEESDESRSSPVQRMCKICYSSDMEGEWLYPCRL